MAKIFLDANIFISIVEKREKISFKDFLNNELFISPISIHILTYLYKYEIPNGKLDNIQTYVNIVVFDQDIVLKALISPTEDFEDNVQLHSGAQAKCDFFLTNDKELLKMKFFGKTKIVKTLR